MPCFTRMPPCSTLIGTYRALQALMRAPAQPAGGRHVLFDHFWVETGDQTLPDLDAAENKSFVVTPSVRAHLRSLARAALIRRYPVLLQVGLGCVVQDDMRRTATWSAASCCGFDLGCHNTQL